MNDKNYVPFDNSPFGEYHKHDADIISIKFEFDNSIANAPKIIFLCKVGKFDKYNGYIGDEYFNLIFINPSYYSIYIKSPGSELNKKEMLNPQKIYQCIYPFTLDIIKVKNTPNHSKWEIKFGNYIGHEHEKPQLIKIYADDLIIEKVKKDI